ncbi:MAG: sulfite exporter TauE/SafE family protein [Desulfurococcales archaeon]|nr:sulfite exporter TauE/SafE family protein [Desulfurococcales archaeon]
MAETETLAYIALGALVATLSSMAGIGGGVFMVPLFYLALGLPINQAVGTSKAVIVIIASISTATYLSRGRVDLRTGTILMATTIPGSYLGAYLVSLVDPTILEYAVAAFILWYSARLIYRALRQPSNPPQKPRGNPLLVALAGIVVGLVAGLTGTGGGALLVPLMISGLGMGIHEAVATSMYSMTMAAIAAAVRHHMSGEIVYSIAIPFALGAVVGAMAGPRIALRMNARHLRIVIGIVLAIVGIRMILA